MGCVPIVMADEIRFPFEDVFVKYSHLVVQMPMYQPERIEHVMMLTNEKWQASIREALRDIFDIFQLNLNATIVKGQHTWAWLWAEYFKACYVATSKRRTLVNNIYLRR
jgi:hypothetical protein